ncbi:MAG: hypothetical protein ACK56I_08720, partial [bacterium]
VGHPAEGLRRRRADVEHLPRPARVEAHVGPVDGEREAEAEPRGEVVGGGLVAPPHGVLGVERQGHAEGRGDAEVRSEPVGDEGEGIGLRGDAEGRRRAEVVVAE